MRSANPFGRDPEGSAEHDGIPYLVMQYVPGRADPRAGPLAPAQAVGAEKYLNALLQEQGLPIPRTHILRDLLALLSPHHPSLRVFTRGLKYLTRFAVGIRYLEQAASKRQTEAALRWAGRVRAECRMLLGLRS